MRINTFIALFLLSTATARAGTASCDAVVNLAVVYYPPSVAVSYTSSRDMGERYCRFSINGYVADESAPEDFKKASRLAGAEYAAAVSTGKQDSKLFVAILPRLLFAADRKFDEKVFDRAISLIKNHTTPLARCYEDFFAGKKENKFTAGSDGLNISCATSRNGTQLETALFQARPEMLRTVLISR